MKDIAPAIYCMLIASLLPILWVWVGKFAGRFKATDNQNPRAFWANAQGLAARAHAVQANSYETLPVFLSAVLLAEYMVVMQWAINRLAIMYIVLRLLYGVAYVTNQATLRSVLWVLGMACPILLFVLSVRVG
jgi:uncharacterized MAPEG superfamily protein